MLVTAAGAISRSGDRGRQATARVATACRGRAQRAQRGAARDARARLAQGVGTQAGARRRGGQQQQRQAVARQLALTPSSCWSCPWTRTTEGGRGEGWGGPWRSSGWSVIFQGGWRLCCGFTSPMQAFTSSRRHRPQFNPVPQRSTPCPSPTWLQHGPTAAWGPGSPVCLLRIFGRIQKSLRSRWGLGPCNQSIASGFGAAAIKSVFWRFLTAVFDVSVAPPLLSAHWRAWRLRSPGAAITPALRAVLWSVRAVKTINGSRWRVP